ncbi:MAG: creatininase family protein [Spirochaetales bacterium]
MNTSNYTFELEKNPPSLAILGVGAIEQHGDHLPISTDYLIAQEVSFRVAEQIQAFLLPAIPYSDSLVHRGFAGTVYLKPQTLRSIIQDIGESLSLWKVKYCALLNCHGGNFILIPTVREWNLEGRIPKFFYIDAYSPLGEVMEKNVHACEVETSLLLYLQADSVRMEKAKDYVPDLPRPDLSHFSMKTLCPGGVWGYPSKATAEKGKFYFEKMVDYAVNRLHSLIQYCNIDKKSI